MIERFMMDPTGNTLAVIVLAGMLISAALIALAYIRGSTVKKWPDWLILLLVLIGLVIAFYLSYVETAKVEAVCGPVGNCNTVQQSRYAYLFGVIPVGVMGVAGYIAMLGAWLVRKFGAGKYFKATTLAIWAMAWFGVLFSIYLTFLEPFVIGATCIWCVSQAIVMTLLLWASSGAALDVLQADNSETDE